MAELTYIEEMLDRMVAMGKECIDALALAGMPLTDGVPYFYYVQEAFPYWTFRTPEGVNELNSEDIDQVTRTVIGSLYCGYATEAYTGELERRMMRYTAAVRKYFNARPFGHTTQFLTSTAYPAKMPEVDPRGVRCTDDIWFSRPQAVVGGGSNPANVLGIDFVFEVPFAFSTKEEF